MTSEGLRMMILVFHDFFSRLLRDFYHTDTKALRKELHPVPSWFRKLVLTKRG
jgi:hypothetical protein